MTETAKTTVTQLQDLRKLDGQELERELLMTMFRLRCEQERQIEDVRRWYDKIRYEFEAAHPGKEGEKACSLFNEVIDKRRREVVEEIKARARYK